MTREMRFFIYLLEHYAEYKNRSAAEIIAEWDRLNLTDFIYNLYEIYHSESINNAFADIDTLVAERLA